MPEGEKNNIYRYIEAEEQEVMSWSDRVFKKYAAIRTTREVAHGYPGEEPFSAYQKFFPGIWNRYALFLFALFCSLIFFHALIEEKMATWSMFLFAFLILLLSVAGLWYANSREMTFTISVSEFHLQIGDLLFDWQDMEETYMVRRPNGDNDKLFLIVGLRNGMVHRFNLTNLNDQSSIEEKLAAAIEHYRNLHHQREGAHYPETDA